MIEQLAAIAADHGDLEVEQDDGVYFFAADQVHFIPSRDSVVIG
jgi:hypothetical protein